MCKKQDEMKSLEESAKPILIYRGFGAVVLSYHQSMVSASLAR